MDSAAICSFRNLPFLIGNSGNTQAYIQLRREVKKGKTDVLALKTMINSLDF